MAFKRVIIRRVGPLFWLLGVMKEFIIRSEQGDDFGLHVSAWQNALTPLGFACEVLPGFGEQHLTMRVDGNEIWFSPEDSFWHISIAGESEWANRVAEAICSRLSSASGLTGKVIPI